MNLIIQLKYIFFINLNLLYQEINNKRFNLIEVIFCYKKNSTIKIFIL